MHFTDLSRALASNVTEARNSNPILDCARIIAHGGLKPDLITVLMPQRV